MCRRQHSSRQNAYLSSFPCKCATHFESNFTSANVIPVDGEDWISFVFVAWRQDAIAPTTLAHLVFLLFLHLSYSYSFLFFFVVLSLSTKNTHDLCCFLMLFCVFFTKKKNKNMKNNVKKFRKNNERYQPWKFIDCGFCSHKTRHKWRLWSEILTGVC